MVAYAYDLKIVLHDVTRIHYLLSRLYKLRIVTLLPIAAADHTSQIEHRYELLIGY